VNRSRKYNEAHICEVTFVKEGTKIFVVFVLKKHNQEKVGFR
jgi:hypothetical protein